MLEAEALERQRKAGGEHGNQHTKSKELPLVTVALQAAKASRVPPSVDAAASILGVGQTIIQQAKKIAKEAPERQRKAGIETHGHKHKEENVQLGASVRQAVEEGREPKSSDSAATILGIGSRIIQQAKQIAKEAPEKQRKAGGDRGNHHTKSKELPLMASVPEAVKQDPEPTSRDSAAAHGRQRNTRNTTTPINPSSRRH